MGERQVIKAIKDIAEIMGTPVVLYNRDGRPVLEACGGKADTGNSGAFLQSATDREVFVGSLFIRGKDGRIIQVPAEEEQTGRLCESVLENLSQGISLSPY